MKKYTSLFAILGVAIILSWVVSQVTHATKRQGEIKKRIGLEYTAECLSQRYQDLNGYDQTFNTIDISIAIEKFYTHKISAEEFKEKIYGKVTEKTFVGWKKTLFSGFPKKSFNVSVDSLIRLSIKQKTNGHEK